MNNYNIKSSFIRKRNNNYNVYIEYIDEKTNKKKQKSQGSFKKKKDAEKLLIEIKIFYEDFLENVYKKRTTCQGCSLQIKFVLKCFFTPLGSY